MRRETTNGAGPIRYRITIRGAVPERSGAMFEDMATEPGAGVTTLTGDLIDQAQLYGVLDRLRALGVALVSVAEEPRRSPHRQRQVVCHGRDPQQHRNPNVRRRSRRAGGD